MTTNTNTPPTDADIRFALWVAQAMKANKPTWDALDAKQQRKIERKIAKLKAKLEKGQVNS